MSTGLVIDGIKEGLSITFYLVMPWIAIILGLYLSYVFLVKAIRKLSINYLFSNIKNFLFVGISLVIVYLGMVNL